MAYDITIIGVGPGKWKELTLEAQEALLQARKIFFRDHVHPVFYELLKRGLGPERLIYLDDFYYIKHITYDEVYSMMAELIVKTAKHSEGVAFATPGNPCFLEATTTLILKGAEKEKLSVRIVPGMSFLETLLVKLNIDMGKGLQFVSPAGLVREGTRVLFPHIDCLIFSPCFPLNRRPGTFKEAGSEVAFDRFKNALLFFYPPDHPITLIRSGGTGACYVDEIVTCPLRELHKHKTFINSLTSVYIPAYHARTSGGKRNR